MENKSQAVVEIEKHTNALNEASKAIQDGDLRGAYAQVGATQRALAHLQTKISALHAREEGMKHADRSRHSSTDPPVVVARNLAEKMLRLAFDMAETKKEKERLRRYERKHSFLTLEAED